MNKEHDAKIAKWLGWKLQHTPEKSIYATQTVWEKPDGTYSNTPNFSTSDSDAITLLPVLVEKGYCPNLGLNGTTKLWQCSIYKFFWRWKHELTEPVIDSENGYGTIAAAITSAVLELIEKEEQDGKQ